MVELSKLVIQSGLRAPELKKKKTVVKKNTKK